MKLLVSTVAPYSWAKLNKHGKAVEQGQFIESAFLNTIPRNISSVIGVAPAAFTTYHQVVIPTKKRSNMLAAVPYALEESLSEDIDQLHFTVMDWKPGTPVRVAIISREILAGWIEVFAEAGVKLDKIVPEHALLPIHPDSDATLVKQSDQQFVIKTAPFQSFSCDSDALEFWWKDEENRQLKIGVSNQVLAGELIEQGGEHISHWDIGVDFVSWLNHAPALLKSAPSLLHTEFEPEHLKPGSNWLNVAASLAVCALLLMGASNWVEAARLQQRYEASQHAIRALFEEAFPGEEYLEQPRRQIASLLSISADDPADEMFQFLLEVTASTAPAYNAEIEEINYRDQQLQMGVSVPNFSALEQLTARINARQGLQAALISSGARDKRVTGQIKIVSRAN
jgi:general secretion pathway protein L